MLGVGVNENRILRQLGHGRTETGHERPVHVIGDDDEVGPLALHQLHQPPHRLAAHRHGWRVAGIHEEERLHPLFGGLVVLRIRLLPRLAPVFRYSTAASMWTNLKAKRSMWAISMYG